MSVVEILEKEIRNSTEEADRKDAFFQCTFSREVVDKLKEVLAKIKQPEGNV